MADIYGAIGGNRLEGYISCSGSCDIKPDIEVVGHCRKVIITFNNDSTRYGEGFIGAQTDINTTGFSLQRTDRQIIFISHFDLADYTSGNDQTIDVHFDLIATYA